MPLCNASWGLGVCSVLVRSVSPCKLVLEVRLFPSPPALFCPLACRWCPLFSSSCLSGLARFRPGVRVKHLNRCKTSSYQVTGTVLVIRCGGGAVNLVPSTAQRRRWFEIVVLGIIIPTYLQSVSISGNGMRLTQEPRFGIQFPTDHFNDPVLF